MPLVPLLSAAAAGVPAGARSLTAIGEWITDAPSWALRILGFAPDPLTGRIPDPAPGVVRRLRARLYGDALDAAIGAFPAARHTRAHHRQEIRRLKTAAFAHIDCPDARQALQVVRWRRNFSASKLTIERVRSPTTASALCPPLNSSTPSAAPDGPAGRARDGSS